LTTLKKKIYYNPTYNELWKPRQGPQAEWANNCAIVPGQLNTLNGFVEDAGINDVAFDIQHNMFTTYGHAEDPTNCEVTIFRQKEKKRKVKEPEVENDGIPLEVDSELIEKPMESNEVTKEDDKPIPKKQRREIEIEDTDLTEEIVPTAEMHIDTAPDYLGRTWIDPPSHLKQADHVCYTPKKTIHTWSGHSKGVSAIRFFPRLGHLLLSCSMDTTIKIWEVYGKRRCVQTYNGHTQAVKAIKFTHDGSRFLSCGYDRYARVWDSETAYE